MLTRLFSGWVRRYPYMGTHIRFARLMNLYLKGRPVRSHYGVWMEADFQDKTNFFSFMGYVSPGLDAFLAMLGPGDCVLDIGANLGIVSLVAGQRVGASGLVIAVEPQARLAAQIGRNAAWNGQQPMVVTGALSDRPGLVALDAADAGHSGTRAVALEGGRDYVWAAPFPEELLAPIGGRRILIKIDCEGFELRVLRGLSQVLATGQVAAVVVEINAEHLRRFGASPAEVYRELEAAGLCAAGSERPGHYDELFVMRQGGGGLQMP